MLKININLVLLMAVVMLGVGLAYPIALGNAVTVASKVSNTQNQKWPKAAWSAEGNCWLVVWREGYISEETDVYAGRVSADGKPLDSAGIRLTSVTDRQEHPGVASDGKDFLVVWEDFRNGRDYDVYAARVGSDGTLLDGNGFLVCGGVSNQCRPAVAFAGGNYYVVWQAYVGDSTQLPGSGPNEYKIYGTRISTHGQVLDPAGGVLLYANGNANAMQPTAVGVGDEVKITFFVYKEAQTGSLGFGSVNGFSGAISTPFNLNLTVCRHQQPFAMAIDNNNVGFFAGNDANNSHGGNCFVLKNISGSAITIGDSYDGMSGLVRLQSLTYDGSRFFLTSDWVIGVQGKLSQRLQVRGMYLNGDGTLPAGAAKVIAAQMVVLSGNVGTNKDCMQGSATSGPTGVSLVTYSETRDFEDAKIAARLASFDSAGLSVLQANGAHRLNGAIHVSPNPFSAGTRIWIEGLGSGIKVKISIYDMAGKLVKEAAINGASGDTYQVWNGLDRRGGPVVSGVYVVRCRIGDKNLSQRVLLMK